MRCLTALAFVPVDSVHVTFEELVGSENWPACGNSIADYFRRTYIGIIQKLFGWSANIVPSLCVPGVIGVASV